MSAKASEDASPDPRRGPVPIAFLAGSLRFGGAERHLAHLLTRLDRTRFEPRLYLTRVEGDFLPEVERAGVPVEESGIVSVFTPGTPRGLRALAARLRGHRIRIVHSYLYGANLIGAAIRIACPEIVHVVGVRQQTLPRGPVFRALFNLIEGPGTRFVSVSMAADRVLGDWGIDERWRHRVPNGVEIPVQLSRERIAALRDELGTPDNATVITMTANFHPIKGHRELIDAFAALVREPARYRLPTSLRAHERLCLVLIGDGRLRSQCTEQADRLGVAAQVRFLGHRDDVGAVLQASDVFVLNSGSEGMSNALLEALAAGLPCIATGVGGNPELVRPGENGFLVPPREPEPLARALARLVADDELRRRLGRRSFEIARDEYSVDAMVVRTEGVYERILGGGNGGEPVTSRPSPSDSERSDRAG